MIAKVKNNKLNVTEVLVPKIKNAFCRNFQFHRRDLSKSERTNKTVFLPSESYFTQNNHLNETKWHLVRY